jgi:hypothetical protein
MEVGVPAGRVRTIPEAVAEPQTAARGKLRRLASPDGAEITVPSAAFKLNGEAPSPVVPPPPRRCRHHACRRRPRPLVGTPLTEVGQPAGDRKPNIMSWRESPKVAAVSR